MAVSLALLVGGFSLSAVAFGQGAGGDQYTPDTGVETTPTATTPTPVEGAGLPDAAPTATPVPDATTGGDGNDDADQADVDGEKKGGSSTKPKPKSKSNPSGSAGRPGSSPADGDSGFPGNRVAILQFGRASDELEDGIEEGLRRAGLQTMFLGEATKRSLAAFLKSPEAKALTDAGPRAIGKAFGAQLVNVTDASRAAFPVVFGRDTAFIPVIRAVLTREPDISDDIVEFHRGVAEGLESTGIPVAYVELSDTKPSFAKDYKAMKVPAVDDIDTDGGKLRLGQIMLGQGTTSDEVDPDSASAVGTPADAGGGASAVSVALLLTLAGGIVLWFTTAGRRLRGRAARDH